MSSLTDPIADLLTRIRNASRAAKVDIRVPYSRIKADIVRILQDEGYIASYELDTTGVVPHLKIKNKIVNNAPVIAGLKRVSRPGLRRYVGATEVPRVLGGMGISILSTPKGLLTGRQARKQNVGGELLAFVW